MAYLFTPESEDSTFVLVHCEMENWRSPLASIPPSSAGQLGEHRAMQVATGELERRLKLQLVSRKEKHVVWSALTQPAWVEETNWLGKKTVTARTLILPAKPLLCGHFPRWRYIVQNAASAQLPARPTGSYPANTFPMRMLTEASDIGD